MNIFKKYYTCDAVEDGKVVGSSVWSFWFWQNPIEIYKYLDKRCKEANSNCYPFNFRRIK